MIKDLIKDLSYDRITLTQALNRAKIIAYEIENSDFKNWISNELNGYDTKDLPSYRIVPCVIVGTIENPMIGRRTLPIDMSRINSAKGSDGDVTKMSIIQSIDLIEKNIEGNSGGEYGYEAMPQDVVEMFKKYFDQPHLVEVNRRIQYSQYQHILNLTKQKLIDTLLELNIAFPNLEDNYEATEKNKAITNTIINNYINGENASSNVGVGDNFSQTISKVDNSRIKQVISDLRDLRVPEEEIEKLEVIVDTTEKSELSKKIFSWIGNLTQVAIEKGIELQIPLIIAKVQELF